MANSTAPLMHVSGTADHLIPLILDDLSEVESRTRARGADGPSIAWHLGHLPLQKTIGKGSPPEKIMAAMQRGA